MVSAFRPLYLTFAFVFFARMAGRYCDHGYCPVGNPHSLIVASAGFGAAVKADGKF